MSVHEKIKKMLREEFNLNEDEIKEWYQKPIVEYYGLTPLDCFALNKADKLLDYLTRKSNGELSGS